MIHIEQGKQFVEELTRGTGFKTIHSDGLRQRLIDYSLEIY